MIYGVLAKTVFESWFLAVAASIGGKRDIVGSAAPPTSAEVFGDAKDVPNSWMASNRSLWTSRDQGALAVVLDPHTARSSPSSDKLWRGFKALLDAAQ